MHEQYKDSPSPPQSRVFHVLITGVAAIAGYLVYLYLFG